LSVEIVRTLLIHLSSNGIWRQIGITLWCWCWCTRLAGNHSNDSTCEM